MNSMVDWEGEGSRWRGWDYGGRGDMTKIKDMTGDERETMLSMTAAQRESGEGWEVNSDDPVMMRKFMGLGLVEVVNQKGADGIWRKVEGTGKDGEGKYFILPMNQLTLRKKRVVSAEERQRLSDRAKANFHSKKEEGEI
jgi:hypothetical protein